MSTKLTTSQQRILDEVRRDGSRTYNGRAYNAIKTLERVGLVTVDWDMDMRSKGNGVYLAWRITVTPIETKGSS